MHPVVWLALAISTEVLATTALKLSDGFTRLGWAAVVVAGYSVSSTRCRSACAASHWAWSTPSGQGSEPL